MDHSLDIDRILLKFIREEALLPEETAIMEEWLRSGTGRAEMIQQFKNDPDWVQEGLRKMQQSSHSRVWESVSSRLDQEGHWQAADSSVITSAVPMQRSGNSHAYRWLAAATVVFAVAGIAFWGLQRRSVVSPSVQPIAAATDARPGGNRAVLTLSNGQQINLDSTANGVVSNQGNMNVTKLADGQLAYNRSSSEEPTTPLFNTLSTPRAGQFSLTLPDGSRVWLNNASSIRYPVAFTGASREVELSGEAYFEITKDASHPFHVAVHRGGSSSSIEVLGTSFNVMAYEDEAAERTTLIDGSVRFVHEGSSALLKPEEQSVLERNGAVKTLHNVNVDEITAWKNGYFHFDHTSLEATMRQLARWYDIDVEYAGTIPAQEFHGKIERGLPLSSVLKGLENDQVHFSLEGRKLIVRP